MYLTFEGTSQRLLTRTQENEKVALFFFIQNQIDILKKKKQRVRWTAAELSEGFTLRYLGKRSYIYWRSKKGYPMPG